MSAELIIEPDDPPTTTTTHDALRPANAPTPVHSHDTHTLEASR